MHEPAAEVLEGEEEEEEGEEEEGEEEEGEGEEGEGGMIMMVSGLLTKTLICPSFTEWIASFRRENSATGALAFFHFMHIRQAVLCVCVSV